MIVEFVAQTKHVCQRGGVTHCHTIQMDLMGKQLFTQEQKKKKKIWHKFKKYKFHISLTSSPDWLMKNMEGMMYKSEYLGWQTESKMLGLKIELVCSLSIYNYTRYKNP